MKLREDLQKKIVVAMKAREPVKVSTFKLLSTALLNAEIAKNREKLTKDEELSVVKREAKKRRDAIEIYEKNDDSKRAEAEKEELKILKDFLPEEMPEIEIEKAVKEVIKDLGATSPADMGRVMGESMKRFSGKADGTSVSEIAGRLLKQ